MKAAEYVAPINCRNEEKVSLNFPFQCDTYLLEEK